MTILVADIGATNARFQLADGGKLAGDPCVLATPDCNDARALIEAALSALDADAFDGAVLAVAGPVDIDTGRVEVTNTGLEFLPDVVEEALACDTLLINDFFALAHAVPFCQELEALGKGRRLHGVKAVLGPGTGLGMATLVPHGDGWTVLPSEGGHADLAPGSFLETELWGVLTRHHGHVCWETVLCGGGLANLYRAMCEMWGSRPDDLSPSEISERGTSLDDPVCHQTLETFCGLLGAAAGNLALTVGAVGGVYIGGGIAPQMLDFIRTSPLRRRFDERGDLTSYAERIPVFVIMDKNPGLIGALTCFEQKKLGGTNG